MAWVARWVAAELGAGYAPAAPGTAGTLLALAVGAALLAVLPWLLLPAAPLTTLLGLWAIPGAGIMGDPGLGGGGRSGRPMDRHGRPAPCPCPGLLPARGIVGLLLTLRFTFPGVL
jgi:hypothetical protein